MATLAQLQFRVNQKLSLDDTAGGDEETLVTAYLNEAINEFLLDTHCYLALAPATLTAGAGDYELDQDILAIHEIIGSDSRPWERVDEAEIHEFRRASATASSVTRYAVAGMNMLMVWPTPASAGTLTIYHVPKPTPLSDASHDPSSIVYGGIPSEYHKALEFYALWQASDYDDDASAAQGDRYYGQYQLMVNKARKAMKMKGGRRQAPLRVGRRVPNVSSDPSRT